MLPKPQSVPFSSYIVFVIRCKVIFISIKALCLIFARCFTSKLRKIKRKDKEIKKNNSLIMRKMFIAGLELKIPDSRGQCANYCAMRGLKLEGVFVLFIDN